MIALPQAASILASLDQTTFIWQLDDDSLTWADNVTTLFPGVPLATLGRSSQFAKLIEPLSTLRNDTLAVFLADERTSYDIQYALKPTPSAAAVWVEERGRWIPGEPGSRGYVQGILRLNNEGHARDQELHKQTQHDLLTGTLNRAHLLAGVAETIDETRRFRGSAAFLLIGIDHLAQINDAFGFDVADGVVLFVAQRLRARLRGGDLMGRFSGNKLGLMLKNCSVNDANAAAERFLAGVRDEVIPTASGPVAATISIGSVTIPRHARTAEEAVSRAQEALDTAKRNRSGSFVMWRPDVEREAQRRLNIRVTDQIVTALNERRIVLAYEPVVDTQTRQASFHECLVRIQQEDGELLRAPDIVPVAERLGLIRLLDHRVLELVIADLVRAPELRLSLNVSPVTMTDPEWWSIVDALMHANPNIGERLIVEITETIAIQNVSDVRDFVTRLKSFGCRIAIDDFGAGYTSFRNLRALGVDIVKIDGAFIEDLAKSPDDRAFAQTLIDLAHRLGIETVAEWVQDETSALMLREWGCHYMQGQFTGLASLERPWDGGEFRQAQPSN